MLSVRDAHARVIAAFSALPAEMVSVADAAGRVLASAPKARLTQPPADLSAMDGYAVRAEDVPAAPTTLTLVGQAPAGGSYDHALKPGIFAVRLLPKNRSSRRHAHRHERLRIAVGGLPKLVSEGLRRACFLEQPPGPDIRDDCQAGENDGSRNDEPSNQRMQQKTDRDIERRPGQIKQC